MITDYQMAQSSFIRQSAGLILALTLLGASAGCQHPTAPPLAGPALQGQAIDAPASDGTAFSGGTRQVPTDAAARAKMTVEAPKPLVKDGYTPVSFAELSDFIYETDADGKPLPSSVMPDEIKKLDQTPAALSGFLVPIEFKEDKVSSMILVRNQLLCCYGQEPKLNEWVFVTIDPPVDSVMDAPVTLYGTLYASPDMEDGQVISLYRLKATAMESMPL